MQEGLHRRVSYFNPIAMEQNYNRMTDTIIIAGPTASGKSALAIDMAHQHDGVIINADSMQIYRDLSIVTACPDDAEKAAAPHRLYNYLDGAYPCSVGKWLSLLQDEVNAVRAQNKVPILCGGTALYLNGAQFGISAIDDIPVDLHEAVITEHRAKGGAVMLAELADYDPEIAQRLAPGDSQRITRAVEVYRHTGRPLSEWQKDAPTGQLSGRFYNIVITPDRSELYPRINQRFAQMWDLGALEEVEALLARQLDPKCPILKAVGVPQIADYLAGHCDKQAAIEEAQTQSRRYAKRQFTFFRNNFMTNYQINETYSQSKKSKIFSEIAI